MLMTKKKIIFVENKNLKMIDAKTFQNKDIEFQQSDNTITALDISSDGKTVSRLIYFQFLIYKNLLLIC